MTEFRGYTAAATLLKELHDARLERRRADAPPAVLKHEAYFVRPLLVLDLDGTLLETTTPGVRRGCPPSFLVPFFGNDVRETRLRCGLARFLPALQPHFDFAVFTAANDVYAELMIAGIDTAVPGFRSSLKACFTQEHAQFDHKDGRTTVTKDLRKLAEYCGVPLCRTLIVDDNPETYRLNQSNALPVPAYEGAPTDDVLSCLGSFLVNLPSHGVPLDVSGWAFAPGGSSALIAEPVDGLRLAPSSASALTHERALKGEPFSPTASEMLNLACNPPVLSFAARAA